MTEIREQLALHCLHLTRREDREISILKEAQSQGVYLKFCEGLEISTNRKMGITQSFKKIVQNAKDCGMKMVAICEDDLKWFKSEDGNLAWDYYLDNMPDLFDLYFGMFYVGTERDNRIISVFSGMTLFTVHENFYDFFLSIPDDCHIDRQLGLTANIHKYMVCPKFVCYQLGGKSDNNQMVIESYDAYLVDRKIYGKD